MNRPSNRYALDEIGNDNRRDRGYNEAQGADNLN